MPQYRNRLRLKLTGKSPVLYAPCATANEQAVIRFRGAIEPTEHRAGFIVCDPLYGNLGSTRAPLSATKVRTLLRTMLQATAHCHAAGVVVGNFGLDSFCWIDPGHTRLVLAGLGSARYLGPPASRGGSGEAFAADVKGLGETFLHIITHHMERAARRPSNLSVLLCRLLSAMLATDPRSRPTMQELLDSPEFWSNPTQLADAPAATAAASADDDQVVPGWVPASKTAAVLSRKRKTTSAGARPNKRPARAVAHR